MTPPGASRAPTLEDVAALAGVSRSTVSRVINEKPNVSELIRVAVESAIDELGYVPNRAARALVTKRSDAIGLIVRESDIGIFRDPFLGGLVRNIGEELAHTDLQLVLLLVPNDEALERMTRYLGSHPVDGIILITFGVGEELREQLDRIEMPAVKLGRPVVPGSISFVDSDNVKGAKMAVRHLVAQGCTRIATITGPMTSIAALDRLEGYRLGLEEAGLEFDENRILYGDFTVAYGERIAATLMAQAPDTDAIFTASDATALGVIRALRKLSVEVPGDVAVVGYDDMPVAELMVPSLSTLAQPLREISIGLVSTLLAEIEDPDREKVEIIIEAPLVVRDSSLQRAHLGSLPGLVM